MFCVNIKIPDEDRLQDEMQNMRTWLDHQRYEPATFRQSRAASGIMFYVYFEAEVEATSFAAAFGGLVESASRPLIS